MLALFVFGPASSAEAAKHKVAPKRSVARIAPPTPQLRGVQLTPNRAYTVTDQAFSAAENAHEMQSACVLGANLVRVGASWALLEKDGPGVMDPKYVATLDTLMSDAQRCGIRVLLMFGGTPPWESKDGAQIGPPRDVGQFRRVVASILRRWPSIYALEVWNEPNLPRFWSGTPKEYADLVNAAVAAKHEVGSSTQILGGTLAMGAASYLQELYASGMHGQDGISLHPYSMLCTPVCTRFYDPRLRLAPFRSAIERIHEVMAANHDPAGIWLTEFGFPTCPSQPSCVSDQAQATWMAQSVQVAACYPYVRGLTAFTLRDIPVPDSWDPTNFEFHFGLMDADFNPKPAFGSVRTAFDQLNQADARAARAQVSSRRMPRAKRARSAATAKRRQCARLFGKRVGKRRAAKVKTRRR